MNSQKIEDLPLITVITVVYNDRENIEATIKSVLNQRYEKIEYIIIDGGSTDGTVEIIQKFQNLITYWISEPDKGIYDAMNKGISLAKGDVIGLLNSGDTYELNAFQLMADGFNMDNIYCVYYGDVCLHYLDMDIKVNIKAVLENLKYAMAISHQAMFISRDIYLHYGNYDLKYKYAADYAYILQLFLNKVKFSYLGDVVACFVTGGTSDKKILVSRFECVKAHFMLKNPNRFKSIFFYTRQVAFQYAYNLMILFLGEKKAANIRKTRLLSKRVS